MNVKYLFLFGLMVFALYAIPAVSEPADPVYEGEVSIIDKLVIVKWHEKNVQIPTEFLSG
jgi:hypothetical protein